MADEETAVAVCYSLKIDGDDLGTFDSCDGLGCEVEMEQRVEGGNNGHVWQLPTRVRFSNVRLSRPVTAEASSSTAVTLPAPNVTLPVASLLRFSRWMAPRAPISVVATSTPSWRTAWPVIVMSPTGALIRPVLRTWPALLSVLSVALISTPVVVDLGLPSVP